MPRGSSDCPRRRGRTFGLRLSTAGGITDPVFFAGSSCVGSSSVGSSCVRRASPPILSGGLERFGQCSSSPLRVRRSFLGWRSRARLHLRLAPCGWRSARRAVASPVSVRGGFDPFACAAPPLGRWDVTGSNPADTFRCRVAVHAGRFRHRQETTIGRRFRIDEASDVRRGNDRNAASHPKGPAIGPRLGGVLSRAAAVTMRP